MNVAVAKLEVEVEHEGRYNRREKRARWDIQQNPQATTLKQERESENMNVAVAKLEVEIARRDIQQNPQPTTIKLELS